jgi:hypothetical protein
VIPTKLELAWSNKDKVLLDPHGNAEPVPDARFSRWM